MLLPQKGSHPDTRVADLKNPISPPYYLRAGFLWDRLLACISHHLTVEARNRPAITSLRLLAVLNVLSEYASLIKWGSSSGARRVLTDLSRTSSRHVVRNADS